MKFIDKDFVMPKSLCPECGFMMDMAQGVLVSNDDELTGNDHPEPGSFTVCSGCAAVLKFNRDMSMRSVTEADFDGAPISFVEALAQVVNIIKQHARTSGHPLRDVSRLN